MKSQYLVIVHGSGWVDLESVPAYWTEVPAHAACASEGATTDEAVALTRASLRRWMRDDVDVDVFIAG